MNQYWHRTSNLEGVDLSETLVDTSEHTVVGIVADTCIPLIVSALESKRGGLESTEAQIVIKACHDRVGTNLEMRQGRRSFNLLLSPGEAKRLAYQLLQSLEDSRENLKKELENARERTAELERSLESSS